MEVNYEHLINYMCPYDEGQISFSLNVYLEKKEKVSDFSELCDVIKSFGEEGIEVSGYYVSSANQEDHKQIIKVRCLDGLTIEPIFEEPKAKVLTRAAATKSSVSVLNAPAVLSDTVNDKLVTLSGLAAFKEKFKDECDSSYMAKQTITKQVLFRYNIMIVNLKGFTGVADKDLQISFDLFAHQPLNGQTGGGGYTETLTDFFESYKDQEMSSRSPSTRFVAAGNYKDNTVLGVRLGSKGDQVLYVVYKSQNTTQQEEFTLDLGSADYYMWYSLEQVL